MAHIIFEDIKFYEEKNEDFIKVKFLKNFYFYIEREELEKIGKYKVIDGAIEFINVSEKRVRRKLNLLFEKGFQNMKNSVTGRDSYYVHKNSGIPLIGTLYFGIIDRGTNIIEIRPITGCNINCIYCSVDEGCPSKRLVDYVLEKDYIVQELKNLIKFKKINNIDVHINSQGEPLLYADIADLVKDIKKIRNVKNISIDTNGTLLSKQLIDDLADAGLDRFNLSLNAIDKKTANKIANKPYNASKVIDMARYITKKVDLIITPVFIPTINEKEMPKLIEFAKDIGAGKNCPPIGIQNFYSYKYGRNPVKELPMEDFFERLKILEKQHDISLTVKEGFKIIETKEPPKPFKRRQIISADIILPGRLRNEKLASSKGRIITIPNCHKEGKVKIKITRAKHNIFYGEIV